MRYEAMRIGDYLVEFSYMKDGKRVAEHDTLYAASAASAAESTLDYYTDYCKDVRIEGVWFDAGRDWEYVER